MSNELDDLVDQILEAHAKDIRCLCGANVGKMKNCNVRCPVCERVGVFMLQSGVVCWWKGLEKEKYAPLEFYEEAGESSL